MTALKFKAFLGLILLINACSTQPDEPLVKPRAIDIHPDHYHVGIVIMDGVYNTELTAPYDVFQHTIFRKGIKPMDVFTIANTSGPVRTFEGLNVLPDFNYLIDDLPKVDILVIPSAEHHIDSDMTDTALIHIIQTLAKEALYITSHCDGAFILAKANLLSQVVSTTFPADIKLMRATFPNLDIRDSVYFVHDGKFITSAGGARSFESALYLCELLYGLAVTQEIAAGLVIDWPLDNFPYLVIDR